MARSLFKLPLFGCNHEFSWPRRSGEGEYYQVCVRCGAEYIYDWSTMRRTRPVMEEGTPHRTKRAACSGKRSDWRPRARRLAVELPVHYRQIGGEWSDGVVRNVSQSGVLIESKATMPAGADLEVIFEMPEEICGQPHRRVLCSSTVVRVDAEAGRMAASISGYEFLSNEAD